MTLKEKLEANNAQLSNEMRNMDREQLEDCIMQFSGQIVGLQNTLDIVLDLLSPSQLTQFQTRLDAEKAALVG